MSRCYNYAIAQFLTDSIRNERLNLALVVLKEDRLEVRMPKSLDKIRAISAAVDLDMVRDSLEQLPELYSYIQGLHIEGPKAQLDHLQDIATVSFSSVGEFFAPSDDLYNQCLDKLLIKLVEPEPAPPRDIRRRSTKLLSDVKSAFKAERVLAKKGESLEAHRIVANHKVAEGLPADLLLKNGAMHVIQIVDAPSEEGSVRRTIQNIAVSALVFEGARMSFGEDRTKSRLVYKANSISESIIAPSLSAAEHQGATLVNWESRDDRIRFIAELSSLAEPLQNPGGNKNLTGVHASMQHKFHLN